MKSFVDQGKNVPLDMICQLLINALIANPSNVSLKKSYNIHNRCTQDSEIYMYIFAQICSNFILNLELSCRRFPKRGRSVHLLWDPCMWGSERSILRLLTRDLHSASFRSQLRPLWRQHWSYHQAFRNLPRKKLARHWLLRAIQQGSPHRRQPWRPRYLRWHQTCNASPDFLHYWT